MYQRSDRQAYAAHRKDEQLAIAGLIAPIQSHFLNASLPQSETRKAWLSNQLARLEQRLQEHFCGEREGGCVDEAVSLHPSLARLTAEYEHLFIELLCDLGEIQSHCQTYNAKTVKRRVLAVLRRLDEIMRLEKQIVQEGLDA